MIAVVENYRPSWGTRTDFLTPSRRWNPIKPKEDRAQASPSPVPTPREATFFTPGKQDSPPLIAPLPKFEKEVPDVKPPDREWLTTLPEDQQR